MQPKTQKPSEQDTRRQEQAAKKAKNLAISVKQRELQALRSTPAGTQVAGFG